MRRRSTRCAAAISIAIRAIVCWLAAAPSAIAADRPWRNPDGGTFSNGGNWFSGVPGTGDVATFGLSTPGVFGALPPYTVSFVADATNQGLRVSDDRVIFDLNGHFYTTTASSGAHIGTVSGSSAALTVTDGTLSLALGSDLAVGANSPGFLTVSTGGRVIGNPFLLVGGFGAGTLSVQNGGELLANATQIGNGAAATSTATVTGASSLLTGPLTIGNFGPGALNITSGGRVGSTDGDIAKTVGSMGTVNVNGTNSRWDNSFGLNVGSSGNGTLNISGGGQVSSDSGVVARAIGSTGAATIDGPNSSWLNSSDLIVGSGGAGTMNITAGGLVQNALGIVGFEGPGTVHVDGLNSQWVNSGNLYVGFKLHSTGLLEVANGGRVEASAVTIGERGNGTLNILSGGRVDSTSGFSSFIAYLPDSTGMATINGANSTWLNSGNLYVGYFGAGTMNITAGGLVQNERGYVGFEAPGTVHVDGLNSRWINTGDLLVGVDSISNGLLDVANGGRVQANAITIGKDGNGTLNISSGGRVESQSATLGLVSGSTGSVTVAGAGSTWTIDGPLHVGNDGLNDKGVGTLRIQPGGRVDVAGRTTLHQGDLVSLEGGTLSTFLIDFLQGHGTFQWTSGTLSFSLYDGNLLVPNGGVFAPDILAPGFAASVNGGYVQRPGATLEINFIDQLNHFEVFVTDIAELGGTLALNLNGVVPNPSATYTIFDALSISGSFTNVASGQRLTTVDGGGSFVVNYGAGSPFDPTKIILSSFLTAGLPGDYNQNGVVDAADYTLWRNNLGSGTSLPNDDTPGVGPDDYTRWKTHFGQSAGSAAATNEMVAVPEPATLVLFVFGTTAWIGRRTRDQLTTRTSSAGLRCGERLAAKALRTAARTHL